MFSLNNFNLIEEREKYKTFRGKGKGNIILFGCSYAAGLYLNEKDNIGTILSEETGKTVYNRAISGCGTATILYQLQNMNIKQEIPNADYIIYEFIPDHFRRNLTIMPNCIFNEFTANYRINKYKKLELYKYSFFKYLFYSFYITRLTNDAIIQKLSNSKYSTVLFTLLISEIYKTIKKLYPKAKFIILVYCDYDDSKEKVKDIFNRIKREFPDIDIVYTTEFSCGEDIIKRKYLFTDKIHPSKEVWQVLIPEFSQKYIK